MKYLIVPWPYTALLEVIPACAETAQFLRLRSN